MSLALFIRRSCMVKQPLKLASPMLNAIPECRKWFRNAVRSTWRQLICDDSLATFPSFKHVLCSCPYGKVKNHEISAGQSVFLIKTSEAEYLTIVGEKTRETTREG